jgi:CubicO group peptidase (beta-lactamase class C family)
VYNQTQNKKSLGKPVYMPPNLFCRRGFLFFTLLFTLNSVAAQQLKHPNASQKPIDLTVLREQLKKTYTDSAVGWAFTIWKGGKQVEDQAGGFKITPIDRKDGKGVPFTSSTQLHVASFSKTITALAIAKLIDQKKLKWDDRVKSFLPSYWKLHPDFQNLTLAELVAMKSGLDGPLDALSSHTDSLRNILERRPNPKKKGVFHYQNTSYGLLRIIIGYAQGYQELQPGADSAVVGVMTANMYKAFVNEQILKPAGVTFSDCKITDTEPAFQYPFPYANEPGELTGTGSLMNNGDLSEYAGAFGWYLSAVDAAKLMSATFVERKILSSNVLTELFNLEFPFKIRRNAYTEYFASGGDWGHPIKDNGWRGIHAYYYCFPDGIVVTVFLNSGEGSPTRRVLRAYQKACQ